MGRTPLQFLNIPYKMKKLFTLLCASALLLFAGCEQSPKTFTFKDVSFTYPSSFTIKSQEVDDDGDLALFLLKDDDTFMSVWIIEHDEEEIASLSDAELREAIREQAVSLFELDLDDEDMVIDGDPSLLNSPEGSTPGTVVSYSGTNYGDPFLGRASCTLLGKYTIELRYQAMTQEALDPLVDIATSFTLNQ